MPATEEERSSQSLPLAMQALFYNVGGGLVLFSEGYCAVLLLIKVFATRQLGQTSAAAL